MTEKQKQDLRQVNIRLPKDLVKRAKRLALEQDRPLQEIIAELLREHVRDAELERRLEPDNNK